MSLGTTHQPLRSLVLDELRRLVVTGELPPGTRLVEEGLAALACGARDRILFDHWINPDYSPRFGSAQAIMKAALGLRGVPAGPPRPPLLPLAPDEVERVRATLVELGLV